MLDGGFEGRDWATIARTRAVATVMLFMLACGGGDGPPKPSLAEELNAEHAAKEAKAEAKKAEEAKQAELRRKQAEEAEAKAYDAAKAELEPLAKLPKKRPKGFGKACDQMLPAYEAYMDKTLTGDALTGWTNNKESRLAVVRRSCHAQSVEATVCQTQLFKAAPEGVHVDHIMRLCTEKF